MHISSCSHQATLIDGKAYAAALHQCIRQDVIDFHELYGVTPGLAVVLVGNDPASEIYVRNKALQTHHVGMRSFMHMLPETTSESELLDLIKQLNADPVIHGILVQLPLPSGIEPHRIINTILPEKDVDGLGEVNVGRLASNRPSIIPCTPLGCLLLLRDQLGDMTGQHAVVIGCSHLVGKPLSLLLLAEGCTVSIAHIHTRNIEDLAKQADILVSATGCHGLVRGTWIKPGATVIDVGITRLKTPDGKSRIVGDVAFDEAVHVAGRITPVPGGVGPMTIACLLENTLTAARLQMKESPICI